MNSQIDPMASAQDSPTGAPSQCPNCQRQAQWNRAWGTSLLVRCAGCGGYTWLGDVSLDGLYEQSYFTAGEYVDYELGLAAHRRNFQRKIQLLERHSGISMAEARLLEIGSATGAFLIEAKRAGTRSCLGIEVSSWARDRSQALGANALAPDDPGLIAAIRELQPNMIVAWDTWEHLKTPADTVAHLAALLAPGGVVSVSTVDSSSLVARLRKTRWRQFHPPTHLNYPSRASFRQFFGGLGMDITYHRAFGYHRPLSEYARALGVRQFPRSLAWARSLPVHLNLLDTQLCIARRLAHG